MSLVCCSSPLRASGGTELMLSVLYSDRRAVQAIGRIDRGADQNEGLNGTLLMLGVPLPPQAKKQGLCEVGDQVVVSQCPSAFDRGIVKVRVAPIAGGLPASPQIESTPQIWFPPRPRTLYPRFAVRGSLVLSFFRGRGMQIIQVVHFRVLGVNLKL